MNMRRQYDTLLMQLRQAAEAQHARAPMTEREPPHPVEELLHELSVHQIELEMQNEQLRQTQVALEESRDRYVDLYEFAPVGYLTLTDTGMISEINLTCSTLLKVERKKLLHRRFISFVAPECCDRWNRLFVGVLRHSGVNECEMELMNGIGKSFYAQLNCVCLSKEGAAPVVRITLTDITERKLAELQLMESEQQYRTLADSGQALVWASGTDKLCNYFNQVWLDFTGRSMEQEFGNGWAEGVHPDDFQRCLDVYVSSFDRREKFSMEYRLRHHDGKYRWIQDDGCPRYSSKGEFIGYIGYCLDITGRKQTEQQLRDLAAHLESVREEEKTSIAREIHDDLGSTLTALKMKTYLFKTELPENKEKAQLLDHIKDMTQLIDNASGAMRNIITGLRPPILDEFGLLAALEWQAGQFQKHTGIKCRVNCIGDKGDLDKQHSVVLFRIFQEALTNVARHSGASSVGIEFHHNDEEVAVSVIDNGIGLPENQAVKPDSFGLLGMRKRINRLGGEISLAPSPGGGLSITAILPLPAG